MAAAAAIAPFHVGKKELYLPKFTLSLLRSDNLAANYARFLVPLWFSKLDLRDYLYHVYNVRIHAITSYVKQSPARFGGNSNPAPMARRWHRPRAKKFMTVQLERPFVYPAEPEAEELEKWSRGEFEGQKESQETMQERMAPWSDTLEPKEHRKSIKEQAKALLEGKQKWKPATNKIVGSMTTRP